MKIKLELSKWVAQQKKQGQKKTTPRAQPQKKKKRVRKEDNLSFRDIENLMGSNRATYGRRHGRVVSKRR
ncbi:hypothetical protein FHE72_23585 (plasmid) [Rossellomorea vietnamensis]|uniref:Uncharacterized protein n=1 Tax=Rossellomorea vietnamensis TaxID=218284 RepID=A0A6I6UXL9_9BACI|nr:hypothetical protein [Rossellomorea vietnamensis]QHE63976.1 hypothetical protein FHE72_23585 [Rossellomorea vietnamensis]